MSKRIRTTSPTKNGRARRNMTTEERTSATTPAKVDPLDVMNVIRREVLKLHPNAENVALVIEWHPDRAPHIETVLGCVPGFIPNIDLPWSGSTSELSYPSIPHPGEEQQ
jgi:hypothetical protein